MRIIALSSSRGTTFQAVLDAKARGEIASPILGLITDRSDRGCIEKAKRAGIAVVACEKKAGENREAFDCRLDNAIRELAGEQTKDVVLAAMGWMFIFSPTFIRRWHNRIINVHPALLPKYGGKGMYGHHVHDAVLKAKENESGVTIHLMDEGVDTGRTLVQKTCRVERDDTAETLQKRVQELEKEWYPKTLAMIERGELTL
jgi:phosphoribosylglycinamide formyltransferase-1